MTKNILSIVVGTALSCALSAPCLALQKTWGDLLQDTSMDEVAARPDKMPRQSVINEPDSRNAQSFSDNDAAGILARFSGEPGIQDAQEAAIRYAEVHKEKIDEWRKGAKHKALLPTLSVGVNRDMKSTSEIYTSATRSYWEIGPNDTVTGWDVNLSWDLGDLIWNNDQNSIDVRSRLMVQLRDDILNEVTRLYFERRRLQVELLTNPPANLSHRLDKELRLQELTAGLDALTGGWFSKYLFKQN